MADRTLNRQPMSVSVRKIQDGFFNHTNFKGLCDNKNDVTIDVETFADIDNVYVDDSSILTSRPPLKFYDGEAFIIDQWMFGNYGIRLHRLQTTIINAETNEEIVDSITGEPIQYFAFILRCFTHELNDNPNKEIKWLIPVASIGYDFVPKVTCIQIEDKIYTWFAGIDFVCLNTSMNYFEDATKYLYLPIHKLVINGIESDLETKNFLTETYRKRHNLSATSSVNFEKLIGRDMTVSLNSVDTQNKSKHLYDITVQNNQDKMLIYPYSPLGSDCYVEAVETSRANVVMKYRKSINLISVSFDGRTYRDLPRIENLIGNPILTKDGMGVVAFTRTGLAKCKLVAQETADFLEPEFILSWNTVPYLEKSVTNGESDAVSELNPDFAPRGYFITLEQFAYLVSIPYETLEGFPGGPHFTDIIYAEWLYGTYDVVCAKAKYNEVHDNDFTTDDIKVFFTYTAPLSDGTYIPALVSVIASSKTLSKKNKLFLYRFMPSSTDLNKILISGDKIKDPTIQTNADGRIYKLTSNAKTRDTLNTTIYSGDKVFITDNVSLNGDFSRPMHYEKNGNSYMGYVSNLAAHLSVFGLKTRWIITKVNGESGPIKPLDPIKLTSYEDDVSYTAAEMKTYFGDFRKDPTDPTDTNWEFFKDLWVTLPENPVKTIVTNIIIRDVGNPMYLPALSEDDVSLLPSVEIEGNNYTSLAFATPCERMDFKIVFSRLDNSKIFYDILVAYPVVLSATHNIDLLLKISYNITDRNFSSSYNIIDEQTASSFFVISNNTNSVLTEKYLYIDNNKIFLPDNGELSALITDKERYLHNDDNLVLEPQEFDGNIHRLTSDGINLSSSQIMSGDVISYTKDASTESDYLTPGAFGGTSGAPLGLKSNRFIIQKLSKNFTIMSGSIRSNDLVCLSAYPDDITLPVGNPGNPYEAPLVIQPLVYPAAPLGWTLGDGWPTTGGWADYKPIATGLNEDGTLKFWQAGDVLPPRSIELYGFVNLYKRIKPLSITENSIWYIIDGTLWTSELSASHTIELDEYINAETKTDGTFSRVVQFTNEVPDYNATLNEHFISFTTHEDSRNLLQVTSTRYDEDKIFSNEGYDILLYLPKKNEQQFSKKITNLHVLSENDMGIFTQDEIWYIQTILDNYGSVSAITKPIKSKIPVGCRDGSDVTTALDGQMIIFTTLRGIASLSPKDFIATTEQTLSYLSDNIQSKYYKFYNDSVHSTMLIPDEFDLSVKPMIKIVTYKYWIMFYRYMDREILALDTRTGSWWVWTTPYPIRSIVVNVRLNILMQIDFNPIENMVIYSPPKKPTLLGVSFVWKDLDTEILDTYYDDVIGKSLNGLSELRNGRRIVFYADPMIKWYILSQHLHFNEINNYKSVKALVLNAKGNDIQTAKISTKVFRDFYHPDKSEVVEIKINDLRTFVKRMNLMHIINFQYKLETDIENEQQSQLKLNSISVKYELKERVR